MKSVLFSAAVRAIATSLAGLGIIPTREQQAEAVNTAMRQRFGRKPPKNAHLAVQDPFFGIKSRGRHGAAGRAALMAEALAERASGLKHTTTRPGQKRAEGCRGSRRGKSNDAFIAARKESRA